VSLPAPDTNATAHTTLAHAVDQLCSPGRHRIARADPIVDDQAAQLLADDRATTAELTAAVQRWRDTRHRTRLARAQAALDDHARRVTARRARISAVTAVAYTPPLLDQLRAEIAASSSGTGSGSASPYRSVIAIPAAELLAHIERTVGHHRRRRRPLVDDVRAWATNPPDLPAAATQAQRWAEQITTLLNPPKRWHHPGACPDCGHSVAYTPDDTGQTVRHPAIQFNRDQGTAQCLRCPARWTSPAALRNLARVLVQQQEHQ
jgi:hypothetical protein